MADKKLGAILVTLSIILGFVIFSYGGSTINSAEEHGCYTTEECREIEKRMNFTHIVIGLLAFILSLGFYLFFFDRTEQRIKDIEKQKKNEAQDSMFNFALKFLDKTEASVLKIIKENPGITQSTLRIKSDTSKAKLSYVLQDLEKRNLIKRETKGKTLSIHLKI